MFVRLTCAAAMMLVAASGHAHELFLKPDSYQIELGDRLQAEIKVGEEFEGGRYIFDPSKFRRFEVAVGDTIAPVEGRLGDLPSVNVEVTEPGLHILVHESTDLKLRYTDFEKFEGFVAHKDLAGAVEAHEARALSKTEFTEAYSRYAKSLVAVGEGAGQDRAFGLETEIVALANPYTDDLDKGLPVQVFYRGDVRRDAQVELFERMGEVVTITRHRTDENGIASLPVRPGAEYMADAVVIRQPDAALATELGAVWETLWANLTFAVPD